MNSKAIFLSIFILLSSISIFAQTNTGYVSIKKGELFYRIWGEGKPLLFLNGGPGFSSEGYEMYAKELSKNRQVILFDQRGTGKSKITRFAERHITINEMTRDIEALRMHLKIDTWDVMGHSFGGEYAMHYATLFGENIDKLILSASPSYVERYSIEFKSINKENASALELKYFKMYQYEINKNNPSKRQLDKIYMALYSSHYVIKPENHAFAADWFFNKCNRNLKVNKRVNKSKRKTKTKKKLLQNFKNPVLIVHGEHDWLDERNPNENLAAFQNAKLEIIKESGHMMLLDQKEKYLQIINDFLKN